MTHAPSIPYRKRWLIFAAVLIVCVGIDQWSKIHAVQHWKGQPAQSYFNDMFRIEYAENHGAFLSLLANMSPSVRFWTLTVINGVVLLGLAVYLCFGRVLQMSSFFPLSLVVAGGIGNLIDRARFGYVIDYFNLGIGELRTGIFNVADMAITLGFLLMLPLVLQGEPQPEESPAADASPEVTT